MAEAVSGPPVATGDVHVTGRRILAIIVDGLVLGVVFWVLSMLFGSRSVEGTRGERVARYTGNSRLPPDHLRLLRPPRGLRWATLGKMLLGIKVVRESGGDVPPGFAPPPYGRSCAS